jgi:hypothetical protein
MIEQSGQGAFLGDIKSVYGLTVGAIYLRQVFITMRANLRMTVAIQYSQQSSIKTQFSV